MLTAKKEYAHQPYKPTGGQEISTFMALHCDRCAHDCQHDSARYCELIPRAIFNPVNSPGHPKEWVRDADGMPTCTRFVKRDI
jgi:hypothetical protein